MSLSVTSAIEPILNANNVQYALEDPLYGLVTAYEADTCPKKVDLGVGAYKDDTGKPWVLSVVQKVGHHGKLHAVKDALIRYRPRGRIITIRS